MTAHRLFATAARGIEPIVVDELRAIGATDARQTRGGVELTGSLELAYRACLWSRCANRILMFLAELEAPDWDVLYEGIRGIDWGEHVSPDGTIAVEFNSVRSELSHTHFGAQKVKDAIVDRFRDRDGRRPSVDTVRPDLRVNVYVHRELATVRLDLSGESLHRRGYRLAGAAAPLKETLAAALLVRAGWPLDGPFVDPMCGSGTLAIEAALMAGGIAPGGLGRSFGFERWPGHDAEVWASLMAEAREARQAVEGMPRICGSDRSERAIAAARENAARAGVDGLVELEVRALADLQPDQFSGPGLVVTNPPYGERLEQAGLAELYAELGRTLRSCFAGWRASVLTAEPALARSLGLRADKKHAFFNGPIECQLCSFGIRERQGRDDERDMFADRLRKNLRHLRKWIRREEVHCYRVYDADIPQYNVAVDVYEDRAVVQEYAAPSTVSRAQAQRRLDQVVEVVPGVLEVEPKHVHVKLRRRQRGDDQYDRVAERGDFLEVREGQHRFLVNLTDYLDTGLFLDHRPTRKLIGELARGRSFLNLFAYTGTATVYAARAGARSTTTVDLSRTYLDWARENLELNEIAGANHQLVRADCLEWIEREKAKYELIFLDVPTFSNSKSMRRSFDVERDHVELIRAAAARLAPGGVLIFACNRRRFELDAEALEGLDCEDITRQTVPTDFARTPKIHRCWRITRQRAR